MKNLVRIVAFFMVVTLVESCRHDDMTLCPFGWSNIDPVFDSLTVEAEKLFLMPITSDEIERLADQMDSVADIHSGRKAKEMKARTSYWKAYLLNMIGMREDAFDALDSVAETTSDEYTLNRAHDLKQVLSGFGSIETFKYLLRQLDYYRMKNAVSDQADIALFISNSLQYEGVPDMTYRYLMMADSLYRIAGLDNRRVNVRANEANLLAGGMTDVENAEQRFAELLADSAIIRHAPTKESMLRTHYYFFEDSQSLFDGYEIVRPLAHPDSFAEGLASLRGLYEALICEHYMNAGRMDSAAYYIDLVTRHIGELDEPRFLAATSEVYVEYYQATGKHDRELEALRKYRAEMDSISRENEPETKVYLGYINALHQHEIESEKVRQDLKIRHYTIIAVLVLLLFAVIIVVQRWRQRQRIKEMEAKFEIERRERQLLTASLSRDESDKMLSYVRAETQRLSRERNVSGSDISDIAKNIKLHMTDNNDLKTFEQTVASVNPRFIRNLREIAPDLSENNVRLCSYLMLGLSNREIGSIMNIKPSSMRQARLRLRQKFGLTKDDSLEDFLRGLAEK